MSPDERNRLKQLVDQARREQLAGQPICHNCHQPMKPHPQGQRKIYCSRKCNRATWRKTPSGRQTVNAGKRRRRETRLQVETKVDG